MAIDVYELALRFKSEGFPVVKKQLDGLDKQGEGLVKRFSNLHSAWKALAGATAVTAITGFLGKAVNEASDAEAALSELRGAIGNVGGDFGKLSKSFDDTAQRMQRFTRFSDDETTRALAKLVTISGDTAGALKNIGLAADIAAFQHTDLNSAAELVGRTMTGNVRGLKVFGITTKDAAQGLEQLRAKMQGVAERDGATFQGRLEQLRNEFGNVLEAVGKVIIGGNDAAETLGILTVKLRDLSGFIDQNAEKWRGWAKNMLDPTWGPANILNRLTESLDRAGLAMKDWGDNGFKNFGKRVGAGGGGGGGGRDTPTGPLSMAPVVVMAGSGNNTPPSRGGSGSGKAAKGPSIPSPNINFGSVDEERIAQIGQGPIEMKVSGVDLNAVPVPGIGMSLDQLDDLLKSGEKKIADMSQIMGERMEGAIPNQRQFERESEEIFRSYAESVIKQMEGMGVMIQQGLSQTLGDAIFNGFTAAFNGEGIGGILKEFGKTILAGIGSIMTQMGQTWLSYGILMTGLGQALWNPFTSGPAAIAIGAALTALGAALGAVAHGTGRGTAASGAFRESRNGTQEIVKLKFVDRPGYGTPLVPSVPNQFVFIGANDPKLQREFKNIAEKAGRR